MKLPGVPERISFAQVTSLVTALGLDVHDLVSLQVHRGAVEAVIYARDDRGQLFAKDDEMATHTVCIPIRDEP